MKTFCWAPLWELLPWHQLPYQLSASYTPWTKLNPKQLPIAKETELFSRRLAVCTPHVMCDWFITVVMDSLQGDWANSQRSPASLAGFTLLCHTASVSICCRWWIWAEWKRCTEKWAPMEEFSLGPPTRERVCRSALSVPRWSWWELQMLFWFN